MHNNIINAYRLFAVYKKKNARETHAKAVENTQTTPEIHLNKTLKATGILHS